MVRKFTLLVNHTISYMLIFKGIKRFINRDEKSGHPQVHKIGPGGLWNEIQVNKVEIDDGRYR